MNNSDKSYLEVKVTFIHVIIMLAAVVIIGISLFFMGYNAGKTARTENTTASVTQVEGEQNRKEIKFSNSEDKPVAKTGPAAASTQKNSNDTISNELKMHQQSIKQADKKTEVKEKKPVTSPVKKPVQKKQKPKIKAKSVKRGAFYSVQTGAFESHSDAVKYSNRFIRSGYPAEIKKVKIRKKTMYRVLVGNYKKKSEASKAIKPLQKIAGRKGFYVRKSDQ